MQRSTTTTELSLARADGSQVLSTDPKTQHSVKVLIETLSALGYDISKSSAHQKLAYSERDAATLLSISPRTLFSLRKEGKVRAVKIGNRVIYPREELKRFLAGSAQ